MTRRHRLSREDAPLRNASPEHLLLLTIFGGGQLRRHVDHELDRRAMNRPARELSHNPQGGGHRAA